MSNYLFADGMVVFRGVEGKLPEDREKMLKEIKDTKKIVNAFGNEVLNSNEMYKKRAILL